MKNISVILNAVLLVAVIVLYYLHFSAPKAQPVIAPPASVGDGIKIAYVDADTLDAKYEWLKEQKAALEKKLTDAEASMRRKKESFIKDMQTFENKYQSGTTPMAELEKEYNALMARQQKLLEEENSLSQKLADDQRKAMDAMMANLEVKLKSLQSQIGYDYILSYSKGGGQVLLANDSLNITNQVLDLLNSKEQEK